MQAQWRRGFGHADERPYRRLTGDAIRLALAVVVVAFTAVRSGASSSSERALDRFFATLPNAFDGASTAVLAFGSLWGVGLALAAALVGALTTFGVPSEVAVATAVTHRLFTTYLPPIWGSYATKWLIAAGYL